MGEPLRTASPDVEKLETLVLGPKRSRRCAEEAPKMPAEVRLITKPLAAAISDQRQRWTTLRDEFARVVQAHQQQVLVRRVTGDFPKGRAKWLRLICALAASWFKERSSAKSASRHLTARRTPGGTAAAHNFRPC
jgi:hypothetical protein